MAKIKPINLEVILARSMKGFAFRSYPRDGFRTADEAYETKRQEINKDFAELSAEEFRKKYELYIY